MQPESHWEAEERLTFTLILHKKYSVLYHICVRIVSGPENRAFWPCFATMMCPWHKKLVIKSLEVTSAINILCNFPQFSSQEYTCTYKMKLSMELLKDIPKLMGMTMLHIWSLKIFLLFDIYLIFQNKNIFLLKINTSITIIPPWYGQERPFSPFLKTKVSRPSISRCQKNPIEA